VRRVAKQGAADGLCGIYCILNCVRGWFDDEREAFRYLVQSAERLGILTSDRLHGGFELHELQDIFNLTSKIMGKDWIAIRADRLPENFQKRSNSRKLLAIFIAGGKAIISVDRREHWVLAKKFSVKDSLQISDSDPDKKRSSINLSELSRPFTALALLPSSSALESALP
jgi:hypothetical protein